MQLHDLYLKVPPSDIAYIQAIFESYEGVGVVRTVDRKQAVIALLVVDNFLDAARAILLSLKNEVPLEEISRPADIGDDWLMRALATEFPIE